MLMKMNIIFNFINVHIPYHFLWSSKPQRCRLAKMAGGGATML